MFLFFLYLKNWLVVQNLRIALSRVFISFDGFQFFFIIELYASCFSFLFIFFFYYRSICIIDDGASRRRTRISRFRARRADHSHHAFRLTLIKKDRQNGELRKGRVFIDGAEL